MGLNDTPSGERLRISFFGKRNAGKSSLVNVITNQEISVLITDTPGFDDEGTLGSLRVKRTRQILNKTDIAVLVTDATRPIDSSEEELISLFNQKNIPFMVAFNKCDLLSDITAYTFTTDKMKGLSESNQIYVSATEKININELKEMIGKLIPSDESRVRLVGDIISENQTIVLVIPIDESAPKGRLILPQQQAIRDILESGAYAVTTRETELAELLSKMNPKPDMVITDSQAFELVDKITPDDIPLTSFSILMARYKGFLETAVKGARAIDTLSDGDKVLISEGCTHHRQCGDIGTVKLPNWLRKRTGKELVIETSSGTDFPENLEEYKLIIHCGGCMLSSREMIYRMKCAIDAGVPFTNYGVAIAYMKGILERSLSVFPGILF